jgi:hypothetical protein
MCCVLCFSCVCILHGGTSKVGNLRRRISLTVLSLDSIPSLFLSLPSHLNFLWAPSQIDPGFSFQLGGKMGFSLIEVRLIVCWFSIEFAWFRSVLIGFWYNLLIYRDLRSLLRWRCCQRSETRLSLLQR